MRLKYDIFISYSSDDEPLAKTVASLYEVGGLRVFLASQSIPVGERWRDVIALVITSAKKVVVLWCCHSSRSDWVGREMSLALEAGKNLSPVRLCDEPLRGPIEDFQALTTAEALPHECIGHLAASPFADEDVEADRILHEIAERYKNYSGMAEVLFRYAMAYMGKEEPDMAARFFQLLILRHPDSEYAEKAREKLALIGAPIPDPDPGYVPRDAEGEFGPAASFEFDRLTQPRLARMRRMAGFRLLAGATVAVLAVMLNPFSNTYVRAAVALVGLAAVASGLLRLRATSRLAAALKHEDPLLKMTALAVYNYVEQPERWRAEQRNLTRGLRS